jgi:hypothetical protein
MYPVELNGIYVAGIYVHEPSGLISNFLMAVVGIWCFVQLRELRGSLEQNFGRFLLFLGLASVGGLFTHGFPLLLGETGFFWLWWLKNALVPIANSFATLAIFTVLYPRYSKEMVIGLIVKSILVIGLLFQLYSFLPAVLDLAVTYVFVLVLSIKAIGSVAGALKFRNAFLIAILSGSLYLVKYDIHPLWLNHKDIVHVFVLWSMLLIYRGAREHHLAEGAS